MLAHGPYTEENARVDVVPRVHRWTNRMNSPASSLMHSNLPSLHPISCLPAAPMESRCDHEDIQFPPIDLVIMWLGDASLDSCITISYLYRFIRLCTPKHLVRRPMPLTFHDNIIIAK